MMLQTLQKSLLLTSIFALIMLIGCDNSSGDGNREENKSNQPGSEVMSVSDYEFLFNDTDAGGAITFKYPGARQCRISFIKSKFSQGYNIRVEMLGQGDIDLTCMTDTGMFALNDSGSTYAKMSIPELTNTAKVNISFSLFSAGTKTSLSQENILLTLSEEQLDNLLNKQ